MKTLLMIGFWLLAVFMDEAQPMEKPIYVVPEDRRFYVDLWYNNHKIWVELNHNTIDVKLKGFNLMYFSFFTKIQNKREVKKEDLAFTKMYCTHNSICVRCDKINKPCLDMNVHMGSQLINVSRTSRHGDDELIDCIKLAEGEQIYGGPTLEHQVWPTQHVPFGDVAYVPTDKMPIAERYFLSSRGYYLHVDSQVPLFLDVNNRHTGQLCFVAKNKPPYPSESEINLKWQLGFFRDAREAHEFFVKNFRPTAAKSWPKIPLPDPQLISRTSYSTWPVMRDELSSKTVETFAAAIQKLHAPHKQIIEIDDGWQSCYGSWLYSKNVTQNIDPEFFHLQLSLNPFIEVDCPENKGTAYADNLGTDIYLKNSKGGIHITEFRGKKVALIDFTNDQVIDWWVKRVQDFAAKHKIDSFKFDVGGDSSWLPFSPLVSSIKKSYFIPGHYPRVFSEIVYKHLGPMTEIRTSWRNENQNIRIKLSPKESSWGQANGLASVITNCLVLNLQGYTFVSPGPVGGLGLNGVNRFDDKGLPNKDNKPPKELFIRWLQVVLFMPTVEFSWPASFYDNETEQITLKLLEFRRDNIVPRIIELMKKSREEGTMINRPLWWDDPTDEEALKIHDQFMLGDDIIIAPILQEGSFARKIYLPKGYWKNGNDWNQAWVGPITLDYKVSLDIVPFFYKVKVD
ncbi:myogenesis-regulating glycosidase-like [Trichogramma pretiosum]|uniref:myogenesis-regulating glycosidase-like n=1 Tax=Trichogramma pretiosum TaxID=7493 RepID=UPI0006C99B0D|nr:myogenesis-regulating glycosidase-like [Trichogramma pretiosum]